MGKMVAQETADYHQKLQLLERFERIVDLVDEEYAVRESEDYKELELTLWLIGKQGSLGCPF